jgi:GntR family transcriptional regulator of vanillate catabolism
MVQAAQTRTGTTTARLRDMLVTGQFPPSMRLTEAVLAERLGVSRTPVRDALNTLAQEGLLAYEPNRGYEVLSCTLDDVLGAYRVRQTLEALACRIVAESGLDVSSRARIMDANERMQRLLASGRWREDGASEWRRLNSVFHTTIIQASGNKSLAKAIADTQSLPILVAGGGSRWFTHGELVLAFNDESVLRSHRQHLEIFEALLAGDAEHAQAVMIDHIERARLILQANWSLTAGLVGDGPGARAGELGKTST